MEGAARAARLAKRCGLAAEWLQPGYRQSAEAPQERKRPRMIGAGTPCSMPRRCLLREEEQGSKRQAPVAAEVYLDARDC